MVSDKRHVAQIAKDEVGTVKTTKAKPQIFDATWDIIQRGNVPNLTLTVLFGQPVAAKLVTKSARNDKRKLMDSLASVAEVAV